MSTPTQAVAPTHNEAAKAKQVLGGELEAAKRILAGVPIHRVDSQTQYVKALIYGNPGAGKTLLASTAQDVPAMSPVLFIDIEGGTSTFRKKYPQIDVVPVHDELYGPDAPAASQGQIKRSAWQVLSDIYEGLKVGGAKGYKTIVLDNLTEAQKLCMNAIMAEVVARKPDRDPDIPDKREYGKNGELLRKMIRAFRDLDAHVIFTAWLGETTTSEGAVVSYKPMLPGKLAKEVPGFFDEAWFLYAVPDRNGVVERKVLCQPTDKYPLVKSRGGLPTTVANPTMSALAPTLLG